MKKNLVTSEVSYEDDAKNTFVLNYSLEFNKVTKDELEVNIRVSHDEIKERDILHYIKEMQRLLERWSEHHSKMRIKNEHE